jgi:hypothetical protein
MPTTKPADDLFDPAATTKAPPTGVNAPTGGIIATAQAAGATQPVGAVTQAPEATGTPSTSVPAKDYSGDLNDIYQRTLNRAGDTAGLDFFKSRLNSGATTLEGVEQAILNSDEYKKLHAQPAAMPAVSLGSPTQWNVTKDQTVKGQMMNLIDPNDPYYQKWATAGAADAAARGFIGNSSIRDTAILDSVMRGATPIATTDAGTYAKSASYNADMNNQFAMKNAELQQQANIAQLSSSTQKYIADQSAATQKTVQQMSNDSQKAISQAHDANSLLIQNNQAAAQAYQTYVNAVANIDIQPGLDENAKRNAIITQTQIFNNAMAGIRSANPSIPDVGSPLDISKLAADKVGVDVTDILKGADRYLP